MSDFDIEMEMLDGLDFETLEKVSKSFDVIDERFGGNTTMKRKVLMNYGLSLDEFPLVYEPSPIAKGMQERALQAQQENAEQAQALQDKLVYGDKWFVLQNRLLNAIADLDLNERRLIMFLSPMVRKDVEDYPDKHRRIFTVKALDFASTYEIKPNNVYKVLSNTADTILGKAFWFWNFKDDKLFGEKTHRTGLTWVSRCNYLEDEGGIEISLNPDIVEMLTVFDKANPFTKYQINTIINLGCYGIILFELIASCLHQDFRQKSYTVKYLKEKFNCIDNYKTYHDFKRYVLDRAIREIHEHTSIRISYEQKKTGRTISELVFSFEDAAQNRIDDTKEGQDANSAESNPFFNFKMTQKQLSVFAAKIKKATGQDIDEIIAELGNVHLQVKHVDFLKVLDFVPSDWYTKDEIKNHPTISQIKQDKKTKKEKQAQVDEQMKESLAQDFEKIKEYAAEFVAANIKQLNTTGLKVLFKQGNYDLILMQWEGRLLDPVQRQGFAMVDEILSR